MSGVIGCWHLVRVETADRVINVGKGFYLTDCNRPRVRGADGSFRFCKDHVDCAVCKSGGVHPELRS